MKTRLKLHEELVSLLGSNNVYFQPPESKKINYPCIIYNLSRAEHKWSGDKLYFYENCYEITIITKDAESNIKDKIINHFTMCRFDRRFIADNLYHDMVTLYW